MTPNKDSKDTSGDDKSAHPVTGTLEDANEHGYLGEHPDPAPNEDYTVEGVIKAAEEHAKTVPQSVEDEGSGTPASSKSSKSS